MTVARTLIRAGAVNGESPARVLEEVNGLLVNDSSDSMFITVVYAVLNLETGDLQYGNAGHNRPLLYRAGTQALAELTQRGIILGAFDEITLQDDRLDLGSGDVLVLYTDGVTDALNADGEEFGEQRLFDVVRSSAPASAQEILWAITGALAGFIGDTEQADDVTCVVVKRD
jgi:sigma-B regulation protein RsbU (phosphoserine phosphatase)